MKTNLFFISSFLILFFQLSLLKAQEYKIPTSNSREGKLILNEFTGNLLVEGYDGIEIVLLLKKITEINPGSESVQKKHLSQPGNKDNTGIGLFVEKKRNVISVKCNLENPISNEYTIKVPCNYSLEINSNCKRSKDILVRDLNNKVEINNCQSINLVNIKGSMVLSTISGNLEIKNGTLSKGETLSLMEISGNINAEFKDIETKEPLQINSISGNIRVKLPSKTSANFSLETISGKINSDFPFSEKSKTYNQDVGTNIHFQTNGGGIELKIATVNGNIQLMKSF